MPGHGNVPRTPVSRRNPDLLVPPVSVAAPAALPNPFDQASIADIAQRVAAFDDDASERSRMKRNSATHRVLTWLESLPGDTWQDRWMLGGDHHHGANWTPDEFTARHPGQYLPGVGPLVVLGVIRPSYAWLFSHRAQHLYEHYRRLHQADTFIELERAAAQRDGTPTHATEVMNILTRMVIVTGKDLRELHFRDLNTYSSARTASGRATTGLAFTYDLIRGIGGLIGAPPTFKQANARGQLTVAELVDRYPIANRPIRDVLVHYLAERAPALDYVTLATLSQTLAENFWINIERAHPGIDTLRLPDDVVKGWKARIRVLPDGRPRLGYEIMLLAVRAFYLDLQQWAMDEPALWGPWSAPCPITAADMRGTVKEKRRRQARMHQRTRDLVPVLPRLLRASEQQLAWATRILDGARTTAPGDTFTVDEVCYVRTGKPTKRWQPTALLVQPSDLSAGKLDATVAEDQAFWVWATIEVMHRTGVRVEELFELTHLSLRQYQAPNGDMVPLLQISPSKTDRERVIPADPELVAVLARIIRRIKGPDGHVPLVQRYDQLERVFGPPLPHLFQRTSLGRLNVISTGYLGDLLTKLATRAALTDVDGTLIRFAPHDFRRIFATETVNSGLPIHIAAKLLGHLDLNTTQGYVAVYPEEVIRHYRAFVDQGRARRPSDEYREPTDAEWIEFRDHFQLRKVALGTCDRPYGTPCQHEHACVRCPMLRLDLQQIPRLLQIERNHHERLEEARKMQWAGEIAAIEEGLQHIDKKKQQADRLIAQSARGEAGNDALA